MVQQIFETAAKIKAAETADEAFQIAALFLSSTAANTTDHLQASIFLKEAHDVFAGCNGLEQFNLLLRLATTLNNSSHDMKMIAQKMRDDILGNRSP